MPRFLPPHLSDVHFPPNLRSFGTIFSWRIFIYSNHDLREIPFGQKISAPTTVAFRTIQNTGVRRFNAIASSNNHGCWEGPTLPWFGMGVESSMKARWLTAREKLMLMGFPVTSNGYKRPRGGSGKRYNYHPEKDWQVEKCDKVAKSYACGILDPYATLDKPHSSVGNSMHIPNCATVLLTALLPTTPSRSRHPFPCPKKFGSRPPNPNGWRPNTGAILFALGPLGYWNLFVHKEEQILV